MKNRRNLNLAKLDISLINDDDDDTPRQNNHAMKNKEVPPSPMGTTYRAEGLSIGRDFMRFEGTTLSTSLSPQALDIEKESILGRGACSVVRIARHTTTNEPLALKIFPIQRDVSKREMLVKELKNLCGLQCDCLVGLIGAYFDTDDVSVTMVLEYMDRGSLQSIISHMRNQSKTTTSSLSSIFSDRTLASISHQILWGLGYLHHEKMIHRDIKPANVLVNSAGQVKLSDFGIATKSRAHHLNDNNNIDEDQMNQTVVGTMRYMSPERLRAMPYTYSSDMWSFGLVLLECVSSPSSQSIFHDVTSIIDLVQTFDDTSIDELIPDFLSKEIKDLLRGCLQKVPGKSFLSFVENSFLSSLFTN